MFKYKTNMYKTQLSYTFNNKESLSYKTPFPLMKHSVRSDNF